MPTTEIVTLNLSPGVDIKDPDSNAAKTFKECGATAASQTGLQILWSGPVMENPEKLQLFLSKLSSNNGRRMTDPRN